MVLNMRLRTQLVLAITFMVAALVATFSCIYISQLLRQRITSVGESSVPVTSQLAYLADNSVPDLSSTRVDTSDPASVRRAISYYLSTDRDLTAMLESVVGSWPYIYDAAIVDADGKAILHSNRDLVGKVVPDRPNFQLLQRAKFLDQLKLVYSPAKVYDVRMPLQLNGAPFGSIRVGVSTVFLKSEITPRLQHAVIFSTMAILLALVMAAALSRLALGPLEQISRSLDSVTAGNSEVVT